jgi:hypothetical protein
VLRSRKRFFLRGGSVTSFNARGISVGAVAEVRQRFSMEIPAIS